MTRAILPALLIAIALAACGGGGAGAGGGAAPAPGPAPAFQRAVPGGTLAIERLGPTGDRFRVWAQLDAPIVSVAAWIGPAYDQPSAVVAAVADGAAYLVTFASPPTAETLIWARVELANGAVIEAGGAAVGTL